MTACRSQDVRACAAQQLEIGAVRKILAPVVAVFDGRTSRTSTHVIPDQALRQSKLNTIQKLSIRETARRQYIIEMTIACQLHAMLGWD